MVGNTPQITVIVATFNAADTLQRCLDSIAGQTYPHTELVVMDGGSTDGTVEIIEDNKGRISYWKSEPDRGVYHAWNKALDHASGEWVCFIGADDYFWQDDALERLAPHLEAATFESIRVVYGRVAIVSERGELVEIVGHPWKKIEKRFRQDMQFPQTGTMHHHSLFDEHGRFDDTFRIAGDYDLLLRELKSRPALFVPEVVSVGMQLGGLSNVPWYAAVTLREVAYSRKKNGIEGFAPWLFWRRSRAFIRAWMNRLIGPKNADRLIDYQRMLVGKRKKWTV